MRGRRTPHQQRAYRIQLTPTPYFENLCIRAKNLYNMALYLVRQEYFATKQWLQFIALYRQIKTHPAYLALKELTDSYIPQQVLRQVEQTWRSYFQAKKAWRIDPTQFQAKPRFPGYKPKNGRYHLTFPHPRVRVRGSQLLFPQNMLKRGFPAIPLGKFPFTPQTHLSARFLPFYDRYVLELIYEVPITPATLASAFPPPRLLGVDLGVNNLVATSDGFLIKGGVIKTINQWFNKQLANYLAHAAHQKQSEPTHRLLRLFRRRSNQITNILHQSSRKLIKHCQAQQIDTLVVGYNPHWKQGCELGKRSNQNFVQIPFLNFLQMLEYKAAQAGIHVVQLPEAYTSQRCSQCGVVRKANRQSRGLYQCKVCLLRLNADLNAARNLIQNYQHHLASTKVIPRDPLSLKKGVFPDSGCVTHPVQNS